MIFTVEIDCRIPGDTEDTTLYFSNARFITGGADTPAHTAFHADIGALSWFAQDLFRPGTTRGSSQSTPTEIEIVNTDGHHDALYDYQFGGRPVRIYYGEVGDAYPSAWTLALTGTVDNPAATLSALRFRVRDRMQVFRKRAQDEVYGGTNALPAGLDGTADDIKDEPVPLVFGLVKNISPPCVNTSMLIYQISEYSLDSGMDTVYDAGVALTSAGTALPTTMLAGNPAAGTYRIWTGADALIQLGSTPAGAVTCDMARYAGIGYNVANVMLNAVSKDRYMGGSVIDYDTDEFNALITARPWSAGVYVRDENIIDILDLCAASMGAWYAFDAQGVLRCGLLEMSGTPALRTLVAGDIETLEILNSNDSDGGVPAWRIQIKYAKNYTVQGDTAGAVTAARRAWLAQEWRQITLTDTDILDEYPESPEIIVETCLHEAADVEELAEFYAALYRVRWKLVRVRVHLSASELAEIAIGGLVALHYPRYGLDADAEGRGLIFRVIGQRINLMSGVADLTLWGGWPWPT